MIGDILQPTHLLFILVVALLVLGPKRLPEAGRALGKGIRDFRSAIGGEEFLPSGISTDAPPPPAPEAVVPPATVPTAATPPVETVPVPNHTPATMADPATKPDPATPATTPADTAAEPVPHPSDQTDESAAEHPAQTAHPVG